MKIMIHSNAPWVPTGYGIQTRNALRQLIDLGHEVAVSAFYGLSGSPIRWPHPDIQTLVEVNGHPTKGIMIYPGGKADYGLDVMLANAEHWGAELLITLMDTWKLSPVAHAIGRQTQETGLRLALWTPVDCAPLGTPDRRVLEATGALPLAMSRHGYEMMLGAGLDPRYVPHSVDTEVFTPPTDRAAHRTGLGLDPRTVVIGLNAANRDRLRKGFPEQFEALRLIRQQHPEVIMMVHTDPIDRGGMNLWELAEDHRVGDGIVWSDTYAQTAGHLDQGDMAAWYQGQDLFTNCSFAEGFGVPLIEAQACGVPVVATDCSAMSELVPWTGAVAGEPFWNPIHRATWQRPSAHDIAHAWESQLFYPINAGLEDWSQRSEQARARAEIYSVDRVRDDYWAPMLAEVTKE